MSSQPAETYQIIEANSSRILEEKVQDELDLGWHLYGSPICQTLGSADEYPIWAQALIRVD
jgi:hypothetical protein